MDNQEQILKLTLLLLYLTSWKENEVLRSWKGYDFDVLNKLEEDGIIGQSKTAKSVYFTEKGIDAAKKLEAMLSI
jgi:hypothetical protein